MLTDFGRVQKTLILQSRSAFLKYIHMDEIPQSSIPLLLPLCLQGESHIITSRQGRVTIPTRIAWSGQVNFTPLSQPFP